jgi:DNA-binding GntR family transcriptional regulator
MVECRALVSVGIVMEDQNVGETAATDLQQGSDLSLAAFATHQTYRERVADVLQAALISGEMRPGELYSAPVLATRLGVSATPVREAMSDLARVGMVEVVRNRGYRVTELSEKDLDDITHLRSLIEVPAVVDLAIDSDVAAIEALRPLATEIEDAAAESDLLRYIEADNAFHMKLLALGGNPHLVTIVGELRSRSRMYGLRDLAERGLLDESAREHTEILDCVSAHDVAATRSVMERHIRHVRGVWAGKSEGQGSSRSS